MVNITYDGCKSSRSAKRYNVWISLLSDAPSFSAGDMNWFDPTTGETIVYNLGDIAWTLASTALVWIMIPGLGFFYSGLLRRKNALSMIFTSMMSIGVVSFQVRDLSSSHETTCSRPSYSDH